MDYTQLGPDALRQLRAERLTALQADHFRYSLLLEEEPDSDRISGVLRDLEERIELHASVLNDGNPRPKSPLVPTPEDG